MRSGQLDEATLRQKYIVEFKPIKVVAAEIGASVGHVYNSLRRYGIENRSDNRLENLQLMTHKEHAALHIRERNKKEEE